MKAKRIVRWAGVGTAACVGVVGFAATAASGAAAQHVAADKIGVIYPAPNNTGLLPPPGSPGTKIGANCPAFLFDNAIGFSFNTGSAVFYRIPAGAPPSMSNGGNVEGNATLELGTSPSDQNPTSSGYSGKAHLWFGDNSNANGHSYFGETISFHGTATDGTSISITANPGFNTSASGHTNGWGQLTIRCS